MANARARGVVGMEPEEEAAPRGPAGLYLEAPGICTIAAAPGSQGFEAPAAAAPAGRAVNVLLLDGIALAALFRSVAYAKSLQKGTRIEWKEYTESTVLNAIYTLMPWKGRPGWVEVDTPTHARIERDAKEDVRKMWRAFLGKLEEGPEPATRYLEHLQSLRDDCLEFVQGTFREAAALNAAVTKEAGDGIKKLATIKLASDVTIAVFAPFAVSIGYVVTTNLIKEWSKASSADAVAIKLGTEAGKESAQEAAEKLSSQWKEVAGELRKDVDAIEGEIAERQKALQKKLKGGKRGAHTIRKKIAALADDAALARKPVNKALLKSTALAGIKWGFVALSVAESFKDYVEIWGESD